MFADKMASEEHKQLAHFLKDVHLELRKASTKVGAKQAWDNHCHNVEKLKKYSQCMEKLATTHWAENCTNETSEASSRIKWTAEFCYDYFINKGYIQQRQKEIIIASKINITLKVEESHMQPIALIDVGSCYNPFQVYDFLNVTAIDLYPANDSVSKCDFLNVSIGFEGRMSNSIVENLQQDYYDVVTFCFLLEYIPTSELRIQACSNAYKILKPGGLLIINTPDSKHVGANSKIMKCWHYTLAMLGFIRIKYEKLRYMHCMAFRKALCMATAVRWATLYQEPYMEYALHIPQDYNDQEIKEEPFSEEINADIDDFKELPFCDTFI